MLSAAQSDQLRDEIETDLSKVTDQAVRRFLRQVRTAGAGLDADAALTAAGEMALGDLMRGWAGIVDQALVDAILSAFTKAATRQIGGRATIPSADAAVYISQVRDRLVHGLTPPLPDDAFNRIRSSIAQANAQGWSRQALGRRIAEELAWETDKRYWQQQLERANGRIDSILDAIGPPGSPAREWARLNDPIVAALQAEGSRATQALEAQEDYWRVRANRIARTEATSASNYASLQALAAEGQTHKEWIATHDSRTRETHAEADGQIQPLAQPFLVGGFTMMMPGDPNGPAQEVVNCRCTIIGAEPPEPAAAAGTAFTSVDQWNEGQLDDVITTAIAATEQRGTSIPQEVLRTLASRQGWNGPIDTLSDDAFEQALAASGHPRLFRGVSAAHGRTASQLQDEFLQQDSPWIGVGVNGNGYYFASRTRTAVDYSDGTAGSILEVALKPNAKVITDRELWDKAFAMYDPARPNRNAIVADPSALAMLEGYDAIWVPGNGNMVVLNRSALVARRVRRTGQQLMGRA